MMTSDSSLPITGTAAENNEPEWYTGPLEDWPWYEVALAVAILTTSTVFAASCVSHMAAAWMLRKEFQMAARYAVFQKIADDFWNWSLQHAY